MADYEEKLAALKMQTGIAIQGRNPAANLITIEAELKKNCISILTDQHFPEAPGFAGVLGAADGADRHGGHPVGNFLL